MALSEKELQQILQAVEKVGQRMVNVLLNHLHGGTP